MRSLKLQYPHEKFMVAADILATSDAPLRDRIESAWMSFHPIQEKDFDGEVREKFAELDRALTRRGPILDVTGAPSTGSVHNTLSQATSPKLLK